MTNLKDNIDYLSKIREWAEESREATCSDSAARRSHKQETQKVLDWLSLIYYNTMRPEIQTMNTQNTNDAIDYKFRLAEVIAGTMSASIVDIDVDETGRGTVNGDTIYRVTFEVTDEVIDLAKAKANENIRRELENGLAGLSKFFGEFGQPDDMKLEPYTEILQKSHADDMKLERYTEILQESHALMGKLHEASRQ